MKKNLSEQVAKQYKQALNKAGAVVYIQAQASINESNEENQQVQQKPLPTTENFNLLPAGTKILDKLVREKALVIDSSELSVNSTNSDFDDCKESVEAFSTDISGLDMCEAGDELTDEDDEIVVPEIYDFDKLSIAETGEKILEAKKEKQLEVDISHLDVEKVNPFS
ncbi:MAG: hypothetical protein HON94_12895 [Methylococcales bacterium]|nr:hypothetical protein [Methylococcales bacterium]